MQIRASSLLISKLVCVSGCVIAKEPKGNMRVMLWMPKPTVMLMHGLRVQ